MKLKQASFSNNYLYLFILGIVISLSAFSCNESEEIILETEPEPLLVKFINKSNYDLSEFQMNSTVQLPNLAVGEETDFIKMDVYTSPNKAKINNKFQDTIEKFRHIVRCGNEEYTPITAGKHIVFLTVELRYVESSFNGYEFTEPYESLFLIATMME